MRGRRTIRHRGTRAVGVSILGPRPREQATVRVFCNAHLRLTPSDAASVVQAVVEEVEGSVARIVFPAGFGRLPSPARHRDEIWTPRKSADVVAGARSWARELQLHIGSHPPLFVGLDASDDVQTVSIVESGKLKHLTWKSLPAKGEVLQAADGDRSPAGLLLRNGALAQHADANVLVMVCHDGIGLGRSRRKPSRWSRAGILRRDFRSLAHMPIGWAFNAIHKLPRQAGGYLPTSFTASHNVLAKRGIPVVAVAGLPREGNLHQTCEYVRTHLRCDVPHVDVVVNV